MPPPNGRKPMTPGELKERLEEELAPGLRTKNSIVRDRCEPVRKVRKRLGGRCDGLIPYDQPCRSSQKNMRRLPGQVNPQQAVEDHLHFGTHGSAVGTAKVSSAYLTAVPSMAAFIPLPAAVSC